jgi:hypothetical protein
MPTTKLDKQTAAAIELLEGHTLWVQIHRRTAARHHCLIFMARGDEVAPVTFEVARLMELKPEPRTGTISLPVNGYKPSAQIEWALSDYTCRVYDLP